MKLLYKLIKNKKAEVTLNATTIIICISFISIFTVLVGAMPSTFMSFTSETFEGWLSSNAPSYFISSDVLNVTYHQTQTVTLGSDIEYDFSPNTTAIFSVGWHDNEISLTYLESIMLGYPPREIICYFLTEGNYYLDKIEMIENKLDDSTSRINPINDIEGRLSEIYVVSIVFYITDPNSTRNNVENAWDEGEINILMGLQGVLTSNDVALNGWDLLMKLLTFNTADIFGAEFFWINSLLFAFITIPLTVVVIWAIASFIPFLS